MDINEIESLTARMAAALVPFKHLRAAIDEHAAACYRRGRADGMGMPIAARAEQLAVREANDKLIHLLGEIADTLHLPTETEHDRIRKEAFAAVRVSANTPAEARTGISDRAAAALADVAEVRRGLRTHGTGNVHTTAAELAALDRIEQALRAGDAA